jgi:hypothetical protein
MRSATTRGWWSASARAPTASAATTTTSSSPWDVSTGLDRILCSLYVTQFENMGLGVGGLSYWVWHFLFAWWTRAYIPRQHPTGPRDVFSFFSGWLNAVIHVFFSTDFVFFKIWNICWSKCLKFDVFLFIEDRKIFTEVTSETRQVSKFLRFFYLFVFSEPGMLRIVNLS